MSHKGGIGRIGGARHTIGSAVTCHVGPNVEAFFITKLPESSVEIYK